VAYALARIGKDGFPLLEATTQAVYLVKSLLDKKLRDTLAADAVVAADDERGVFIGGFNKVVDIVIVDSLRIFDVAFAEGELIADIDQLRARFRQQRMCVL